MGRPILPEFHSPSQELSEFLLPGHSTREHVVLPLDVRFPEESVTTDRPCLESQNGVNLIQSPENLLIGFKPPRTLLLFTRSLTLIEIGQVSADREGEGLCREVGARRRDAGPRGATSQMSPPQPRHPTLPSSRPFPVVPFLSHNPMDPFPFSPVTERTQTPVSSSMWGSARVSAPPSHRLPLLEVFRHWGVPAQPQGTPLHRFRLHGLHAAPAL